MKAKDRRAADRQINQTDHDAEKRWEYEQFKHEVKQEELRRRRIRDEQERALLDA